MIGNFELDSHASIEIHKSMKKKDDSFKRAKNIWPVAYRLSVFYHKTQIRITDEKPYKQGEVYKLHESHTVITAKGFIYLFFVLGERDVKRLFFSS